MTSPVNKVYKTIRKRILSQEYLPSQQLVEYILAEEFQVSRSTVKKALLNLVNDNLVVLEENKSARVKSLSKEEAFDLLEIRERLEGLITYSTATTIQDKDIKTLKVLLEDIKHSLDDKDFKKFSEKNDSIHNIIDDICPNKEAIRLVESIRLQLRAYNKKTILIEGRGAQSYNEHLELVQAFEEGNSEKSEEIMRKHMRNVRNTLIENYNILF